MKFTIDAKSLLQATQIIIGAIDRKQALPILGNVLVTVQGENQLSLLATDLEVELSSHVSLTQNAENGQITVPARKLHDICRSLDPNTILQCKLTDQRFIIKTAESRFALQTLPALDFPNIETTSHQHSFKISQKELRYLLEQTHFAIALQDIRYYLTGLLLELKDQQIRAVATDGHRMALCSMMVNTDLGFHQIIIPRRGVMELLRLLQDNEEEIEIILGQNHIRAISTSFTFSSKLIDGKYPDYNKVIPKFTDNLIHLSRDVFKSTLNRVTILSNEDFRGVSLRWEENKLILQSHNNLYEEAEEKIDISYLRTPVQMGFNASYLTDVLSAISAAEIELMIPEDQNSLLLQPRNNKLASCIFIIMPVIL